MIQGAWLCLFAPLAGAFAITVMGDSITRRTAGWISTLSVFVAFARQQGDAEGQIFALAVMAVAASEVVVGLGLIVALARRNVALDVDKLTTLRG